MAGRVDPMGVWGEQLRSQPGGDLAHDSSSWSLRGGVARL